MMHFALDQLTLKDHRAVIETMTLIIQAIPDDPAPYFQRATSKMLVYEAEYATDDQKGNNSRLGIITSNSTLSTEYLKRHRRRGDSRPPQGTRAPGTQLRSCSLQPRLYPSPPASTPRRSPSTPMYLAESHT